MYPKILSVCILLLLTSSIFCKEAEDAIEEQAFEVMRLKLIGEAEKNPPEPIDPLMDLEVRLKMDLYKDIRNRIVLDKDNIVLLLKNIIFDSKKSLHITEKVRSEGVTCIEETIRSIDKGSDHIYNHINDMIIEIIPIYTRFLIAIQEKRTAAFDELSKNPGDANDIEAQADVVLKKVWNGFKVCAKIFYESVGGAFVEWTTHLEDIADRWEKLYFMANIPDIPEDKVIEQFKAVLDEYKSSLETQSKACAQTLRDSLTDVERCSAKYLVADLLPKLDSD